VPGLTFEDVVAGGFALCRVQASGPAELGVVVDGTAYSLSAVLGSAVTSADVLFPDWDAYLDKLQAWSDALRAGHAGASPLPSDAQVLPPVEPRNVFQAAANYRKHVIDLMVASPRPEHVDLDETGRRAVAVALMDERASSGTPTVFSGLPSSMTGPFSRVVIPRITSQCDWELELAAVIGRPARYVAADSALGFVAGYTIVNDITMRDRLYPSGDSKRGADWLACKSAPTFLPTGPLLVPARFVPDPARLTITLRLNGEVMQDESTADMIFGLPRLIEHTSYCAQLLPGDLLLTGSPAGNGVHHGRFLQAGDVMEGRITGLGVQRTPCVDEQTGGLS
jgi:2,4-didehydro-3-deoxy-L-rhamnonate hydrolase